MAKQLVPILALALLTTGCSIFVKRPVQEITGDNVVCILFKDKPFKTEVVNKVSKSLTMKGYRVITDRINRAKYYDNANYAAVVYIAEYWAWHIPLHAKRYYRKNNMAQNTVFVITSGDPDVVIQKPFDAVTSASSTDNVDRVSQVIIERLDAILKR